MTEAFGRILHHSLCLTVEVYISILVVWKGSLLEGWWWVWMASHHSLCHEPMNQKAQDFLLPFSCPTEIDCDHLLLLTIRSLSIALHRGQSGSTGILTADVPVPLFYHPVKVLTFHVSMVMLYHPRIFLAPVSYFTPSSRRARRKPWSLLTPASADPVFPDSSSLWYHKIYLGLTSLPEFRPFQALTSAEIHVYLTSLYIVKCGVYNSIPKVKFRY